MTSNVEATPSARPRGAAAIRQRILEIARALWSEGGAAAASLEQVALRAGVTAATVEEHFGSRQRLLEALLRSSSPARTAAAHRELRALSDPLGALRGLIAEQVAAVCAGAPPSGGTHAAAGAADHRRVQLAIIVVGLAEQRRLRLGWERREVFDILSTVTGAPAVADLFACGGLGVDGVERTVAALAGVVVDWRADPG